MLFENDALTAIAHKAESCGLRQNRLRYSCSRLGYILRIAVRYGMGILQRHALATGGLAQRYICSGGALRLPVAVNRVLRVPYEEPHVLRTILFTLSAAPDFLRNARYFL